MADKLGLGNGERQLKLGQSFTNPKSSAFHTVRYDFKPASVDINKMASVEVGSNNQVTVTVPHLDGAGVPQTVFKGSQRPYHKECVLIIDRVTGVITLEKLSSNIQVKKTRSEAIKPPLPQVSSSSDRNTPNSSDRLSAGGLSAPNRPQTPPIGQRTSNKTRVTSGSRRPDRPITHLVPKHSPLHASPSYSSPGHYKSPKRDHLVNNNTNNDTHSQSTLASLPMIGMDDVADPPVLTVPHSSSSSLGVTPPSSTKRSPPVPPVQQQQQIQQNGRDLIGEISDTSSSSSDSDSGSDHETSAASNVKGVKSGGSGGGGGGGGGGSSSANAVSTTSTSRRNGHHANGFAFGSNSSPSLSMPAHILSEDLCLSESGSDSD